MQSLTRIISGPRSFSSRARDGAGSHPGGRPGKPGRWIIKENINWRR